MKKLVLVTLLAVAASWLLSEARQPGDGIRKHLVTVQDEGPVPPPTVRPPTPPEPPSPPGSIRTVPWRKGDGSRPKRASQAPPKSIASAKTPPSWFPKSELEEEEKARTDAFGSRVLLGRLSASEDRARQDLRKIVEREVADWIAADVPTSWKVPSDVIDGMRQGSYVQEVTKNLTPAAPEVETPSTAEIQGSDGLYTLYRAGQKLDFSRSRRAQIVQMYRRDLASQRMQRLGGGLALALVGLAVLSGYIKADEATKGYYTNRLRLLAAAGLGTAGVLAYRFLV
jgi:hypothetical protein